MMLTDLDKKIWNRYIKSEVRYTHLPRSLVNRPAVSSTSNRLDLHNITIHSAYNKTIEFVNLHLELKEFAKLTIITGKSGSMVKEFPEWLSNIKSVTNIIPNKDKNGEIGSYTVILNLKKI